MSELQQPPNATGPERSILSSMMQDEAEYYIDRATDQGLTPEWFYLPAHAALCRHLIGIRKAGKPIELISLTETLADRNLLENIGGPAEITNIFTFTPTGAHFDHHLGIVKAKHLQRSAISALSESLGGLWGAETDEVESKIAAATQGLTAVANGFSTDNGDFSAKELMVRFLDYVEECASGRNTEVIETPWPNLNELLAGGIGIGEVTFIAARPSMGKTAFALDLLVHAAKNGIQGQFISIESGEMKVDNRLAASQGAGDVSKLSRGNVTRGEVEAIRKAVERVSSLSMRVRKLNGPTSAQVASAVRKAALDHGAKIVAIDYLQIIRASGGAEKADVRLRMDNALDALCPLASELGISLVILAQLNREAEGKPGKDLNLGMLKETSRIEQDADTVLMIGDAHDHTSTDEDFEPRVINVPKNRDGATSFARLQFHGPTTTFHS